MMSLKQKIADHSLKFIGGNPEVYEYNNDNKSHSIDVASFYDSKYEDAVVVSTIGLSDYDIGFIVEDKPLRTELLAIADKDCDFIQNVIATVAYEIMDYGYAEYGQIIDDVVSEYISDVDVKHILLLSPPFWEDYEALDTEEVVVTWLFVVPITDDEKEYIISNGVDAFDKLMEEKNIDILDFNRKSIV